MIFRLIWPLAFFCSIAFANNPYKGNWATVQGKQISLFQDKKAVLFDFWASWCVPCRASIPSLNAISKNLVELRVVGVNADDAGDLEQAQKFIKRTEMAYPSILDIPSKLSEPLQVEVIPTLILLDANGQELGRWIGEPEAFEQILRKLLKK